MSFKKECFALPKLLLFVLFLPSFVPVHFCQFLPERQREESVRERHFPLFNISLKFDRDQQEQINATQALKEQNIPF